MKKAANGIRAEYSGADLGDGRRSARLARLGARMVERPSASFPDLLDGAELEGAYRLLRNAAVEPEAMLAPHVRETCDRIGTGTVLAVHDTTTLSFRADGQRKGFAEDTHTKAQQFWTHATLAVAADGTRRPYGLLRISGENEIVHGRWLRHVEDVRGLDLDVVHVMDREADDYALFAAMIVKGDRFVIRLQHDRLSREAATVQHLTDRVAGMPCVQRDVVLGTRLEPKGTKQRRVHPARQGRPARLTIAVSRVRLRRPRQRAASLPKEIELTFVRAWEANPPPGQKAVDWMLITTEPADLISAQRVVDWYRARWTIEEFFKALKTGCAIEKRQLETFDGLVRAVALFGPIAWHLLLIRHEARHSPAQPASDVLTPDFLAALRAVARKPLPPEPTSRDVALAIAALGGHLRNNGEPGWITLARGYERLRLIAMGWSLARIAGSDQS